MNGRNHLVAGGAYAMAGLSVGAAAISASVPAQEAVLTWAPGHIPHIALGAAFYFLGVLLPDCDQKGSTIGRYLHLPFEHRTWTHTVWFMLPFILLGLFFAPFYFIAIGIAVHLLCDSTSKCGICWFYPISKYKHFGSGGAKIKSGHFWCLYQSKAGEVMNCAALWLFLTLPCMALSFLCWNPARAGMFHLDGVVAGFKSVAGFLLSKLFQG